jgi:WD40 repeat protein
MGEKLIASVRTYRIMFSIAMAVLPWSAGTLAANTGCESRAAVQLAQSEADYGMPRPKPLKELALDGGVTAVAWSPDEQLIATSEEFDTVVKIWQWSTPRVLHVINKQHAGGRHLAFTADGRYLITSSVAAFDGTNRAVFSIIDVGTGAVVKDVNGPYDPSQFPGANVPRDFVLSPDGKRLYVTFNTDDLMVHIYDVATWSDVGSFRSHAFVMRGGPLADELTLVEADGTARVWNSSTNSFVSSFPVMHTYPSAIALNRQTCRLATGNGQPASAFDAAKQQFVMVPNVASIHVVDIDGWKNLTAIEAVAPIRDLDFSPDGALLAAIADKRDVILYNAIRPSASVELHRFTEYAWSVAFSPSGHFLAEAGDKNVIIVSLQ